MKTKLIFSTMLIMLFMITGCTNREKYLNALSNFAQQFEIEYYNVMHHTNSVTVPFNYDGDIIFASPYALGREKELSAVFGSKVAREIHEYESPNIQNICFVSSRGEIEAIPWKNCPVWINDLFIVKCEPGCKLEFEVKKGVLLAVKVKK